MKLVMRILLVAVVVLLLFMLKGRSETFLINEGKRTETEATVIKSWRKGPTVYVVAGIHGNEPAGMEATRRLASISLNRGTLVLLPEANKLAADEGSRSLPSLGDLNRAFPGKEKGRDIDELAYGISQSIASYEPDLLLDLHESKHYSTGETYAIGHSFIYSDLDVIQQVEHVMAEMNKGLDDPYVYFFDAKEGTINAEMTAEGIPTVTFESDVEQDFGARVEAHMAVVTYFLSEFGMIE